MSPPVTVIVPTAGAGDEHGPYVDRCLASVRAVAPEAEILVLMEYHDYPSLGFRLRDTYGAKIGRVPGPFNFSRSLNSGAAKASSEVLLFLNDDVEAHSEHADWLRRLLFDLAKHPGVVGATLLHDDGSVQHAGMAINEHGVPYHLHYDERGYRPVTREVEALTGACLMTTRYIHDAIGGFDERFALCFSDTDYCLKARAAGFEVTLSKAVLVHHEWGTRGGPQTGMADSRLWYQRWWDTHQPARLPR